jgi:sulfur relay (sulfurtransferase) complex TusBCD TusD component (DsrE family)
MTDNINNIHICQTASNNRGMINQELISIILTIGCVTGISFMYSLLCVKNNIKQSNLKMKTPESHSVM